MFFYAFFKGFYEKAGERMTEQCKEFIPLNSKILDFGCGSGIVGNKFKQAFDAGLVGVDIVDNRVENISFELYNGQDLSFFNNDSFDVVLASYVLHHTENPLELLKELVRVARDVIIVYETPADGIFYRAACRIHGTSFARFFQRNSVKGRFFTTEEWRRIFEEKGLKIVKEQKVNSFPLKNVLFVLKKGV
ncbi:MAG: class I SAM-dependent methyltransferase [Candidatus Pacebacteria bacterium]|nr:class I SAM-dependent methyltransferase [Candidatus Paceibacterota bacterium]